MRTAIACAAGLFVTAGALAQSYPIKPVRVIVPCTPLGRLVNVLVVAPSTDVKSVSELIAAARTKPGQLNFASSGTGTGTHFTAEKFKLVAGLDVVHIP